MKRRLSKGGVRAALGAAVVGATGFLACIYPTDGYREAGRHLDLPPPPEQAADSSSDDSSSDDSSDSASQDDEAAAQVEAGGG